MKTTKKVTTKHAVGYCRVSTDQQDCSLEMQQERIKAYCSMMGFTLDVMLVESDVSGKTCLDDRPEGSKIAGYISAGAGHVIALKLDRLFRNAANALTQTGEWHTDN